MSEADATISSWVGHTTHSTDAIDTRVVAAATRHSLLELVKRLDQVGHPAVHTARLMLIQCDDLIEELEQ